jgi:hypothetical protein
MSEVFIDQVALPPVTELHVWIGHYAEGGEGIRVADDGSTAVVRALRDEAAL